MKMLLNLRSTIVAVGFLVALTAAANAAAIIYTVSATASGTFGGNPLTNGAGTLTANADVTNMQSFKFIWSAGGLVAGSAAGKFASKLILKEYRAPDDHATPGARFIDVTVQFVYPPSKLPSEVTTNVRPIPARDLGLYVVEYKDFKFVALDQRGEVLKSRPRYPEWDLFGMAGKGGASQSVGRFVVELEEDQEIGQVSLGYKGDKATISLLGTKVRQH